MLHTYCKDTTKSVSILVCVCVCVCVGCHQAKVTPCRGSTNITIHGCMVPTEVYLIQMYNIFMCVCVCVRVYAYVYAYI
jgi:hypothetical protein